MNLNVQWKNYKIIHWLRQDIASKLHAEAVDIVEYAVLIYVDALENDGEGTQQSWEAEM